ncbi:hypothetical protein [Demequina sp. NBRC 110051]|uniref:hypothetical protein n=1 Tax=Demequina sp. NBRC 110051 TaxID=1570340 RepID=UPI000A00CE7B|nr:hypothetical protein [Demequina sp. NBRC 110051]
MRTPHVPRRPAVLAAVAGVVVAAGCTGDPEDKPGPASAAALPSPEATVTPMAPGDGSLSPGGGEVAAQDGLISPADVPEMRDLIASFSPEIPGFVLEEQRGAPPYDTVYSYWFAAGAEVTPGACRSVEHAIELATDVDLTDAARDLVQPDGLYVTAEESPVAGDDVEGPHIHVITRIFGDPRLAAATVAEPLAADCDTYTVAYPAHDFGFRREGLEVAMVDLPGVELPTTRITVPVDVSWEEGPDGAPIDVDTVASVSYVHVTGRYAVRLFMAEVDGHEDLAADVIAAFVDHTSGH